MTKIQQLEKERLFLETLQEQSLNRLERLKNNVEHNNIDFNRAKDLIGRIFNNELDYFDRETEDYYNLYINYYYKN